MASCPFIDVSINPKIVEIKENMIPNNTKLVVKIFRGSAII